MQEEEWQQWTESDTEVEILCGISIALTLYSAHKNTCFIEYEPAMLDLSAVRVSVGFRRLLSPQENYATDVHWPPQLETDVQAVRTLYSDSAICVR